jgi:hypothetical protein
MPLLPSLSVQQGEWSERNFAEPCEGCPRAIWAIIADGIRHIIQKQSATFEREVPFKNWMLTKSASFERGGAVQKQDAQIKVPD